MKVTFILSAFNRPSALLVSLGSLINQTDPDWECIVLDNADGSTYAEMNEMTVEQVRDERIHYHYTGWHAEDQPGWDCYWSADIGAARAMGDWLAFPSDDSYYCPEFIEKMTEDSTVDLVYCDILYDARFSGKREALNVAPYVCRIDKTCFMVKREKYIGFPDKPTTQSASIADGLAVERMIQLGYKHRKVDWTLVVHN